MQAESQVAETNPKIVLAFDKPSGVQFDPMSPKKIPEKIMFRPTPDDFSLVSTLGKRLGLGQTQIIRLALRRLAEAEGLQSRAS